MSEGTVSVVLPVYAGSRADHLDEALRSIAGQTRRADEVLVVLDGPVGPDVEDLLARATGVTVVRCPEHRGLGPALSAGVLAAQGEWLARMDADDVALEHRLARQLSFAQESGCDLVGAAMLEFSGTTAQVTGERMMPLEHDAIVGRLRWSNPINHPTVLVRREAVLRAGNYRDVPTLEDYDLWVRMAREGAVLANVPDALVLFRADDHLRRRRVDRAAFRGELALQREIRDAGISGPVRSALALALRLGFRALPAAAMTRAYRWIFLRHGRGRRDGTEPRQGRRPL